MTTYKTPEQAKKVLRKCHRLFERNLADVDCGIHMLAQIRPTVSQAVQQWNEAVEWLVQNDPACPKGFISQKI